MEGSTRPPQDSIPQCCCGRTDCPFLAHTGTLLEGLERDVQTAAQLGQALLVRHEAYMVDAEQERRRMTATIEALEKEKLDLEEKNAQTIKENHSLLDQLEELNEVVAESDAQVQNLTATLQATEEELHRLSILVARTESLETQLAQLERDQAQLQDTLSAAVEDERSAIQRWRKAERTIVDLQDQIDKIEREAREDRERHVEVVGRMERRRAVELELQTAAGRLKGAAAAKTTGRDKNGSSVVSHFVKDILQDNANLQTGIVELREMLLNSNEEVERLREQLQAHQPISPNLEQARTPTLQKELGFEPIVNQELHFHHHYHAPPEPKEELAKSRPQIHRRVRKKRNVITTGHFTPPASHTPRSSISKISNITPSAKGSATTSSSAAILAQTSVTIPQPSHRWSIQSNQTGLSVAASSVPGSPYSHSRRTSSIFDRVFSDSAFDSSRPTSPESNDPGSPMFLPSNGAQEVAGKFENASHNQFQKVATQNRKPPMGGQFRSVSSPVAFQTKSTLATTAITKFSPPDHRFEEQPVVDDLYLSPPGHATIPEENEDASDTHSLSTLTPSTEISNEDIYSHMQTRPSLRHTASHESLLSVSGMDIHTLRSRPSQMLLPNSPRFASPSASATSSKPVLSAMTATATRASMSRRDLDSSTYNRSLLYGMAADQRGGIRSKKSEATLGQKVGGWVFGKWGFTPSPSASRVSSAPIPRPKEPVPVTVREDAVAPNLAQPLKDPMPITFRPPGVNQSGPLFGFFPREPATPCKVVVTDLDQDALEESLGEG
ncbi:hypothetical protein K432DRAFT_180784 [Lepidopterella palustris CBS 459.81]|uniref:Uncharacterized protein n=1 Tax=Lepidopterella palustris CBS 459.81 TaxID=1314670 RepID=A0A8E2E0R4_9PEZI|nr:hypothetical protein K432DRAFT_180784 [Lepidopterella palustris CBS 459.81]